MSSTFTLTRQNYDDIGEIAVEFKNRLQQCLVKMLDKGTKIFINEITYLGGTERVTIANPNNNNIAGYRVALYKFNNAGQGVQTDVSDPIHVDDLQDGTTDAFITLQIANTGEGYSERLRIIR